MVYSSSRTTWASVVATVAQRMNGKSSERVGARGEEYVPESNNWYTEEDKGNTREFSFNRLFRNAKKHRSEPALPFLCPGDHSHPRGRPYAPCPSCSPYHSFSSPNFTYDAVPFIVQNKSHPRTLAPVTQELIATYANEGRSRAVDASEVQPCLNTIFDLVSVTERGLW